jgi:GTP pyrophosphokinase
MKDERSFNSPMLGERFDRALLLASTVHRRQVRKGTSVPYLSHLLGVASIVLQYGGGEDEGIGALLHDAIEDGADYPGGVRRLREEILGQFGDKVLEIVEDCTDADADSKAAEPRTIEAWRSRKERYLHHLPDVSRSTLLVSCSDKLFNLSAIVEDFRSSGNLVFEHFHGGRDGTLWYYGELCRLFDNLYPGPLSRKLTRRYETLIFEMQ